MTRLRDTHLGRVGEVTEADAHGATVIWNAGQFTPMTTRQLTETPGRYELVQ